MKVVVNSYELHLEDLNIEGYKTREELIKIIIEEIEQLADRKVSKEINKYLNYEGDGFYYEERVEEEREDLDWNNIFEFEEEEMKT